jgi:hypothetical protein
MPRRKSLIAQMFEARQRAKLQKQKRHHHAKHAPGWHLQQTRPGVMRWTTPSGRTYTTRPTQYDE